MSTDQWTYFSSPYSCPSFLVALLLGNWVLLLSYCRHLLMTCLVFHRLELPSLDRLSRFLPQNFRLQGLDTDFLLSTQGSYHVLRLGPRCCAPAITRICTTNNNDEPSALQLLYFRLVTFFYVGFHNRRKSDKGIVYRFMNQQSKKGTNTLQVDVSIACSCVVAAAGVGCVTGIGPFWFMLNYS